MFFGLMALAMVGVRYKSDRRDQYLQHGGWFVKVALWLVFSILPFFFPASFVNGYGKMLAAAAHPTPLVHAYPHLVRSSTSQHICITISNSCSMRAYVQGGWRGWAPLASCACRS